MTQLAQRLAELIDNIGGGYPLLSLLPDDKQAIVLWQYEKHDFVVRCSKRPPPFAILKKRTPGSPTEIQVGSIFDALDLIRQTEKLRQENSEFPYVRLGLMPGTRSDLEFRKHNF